MKYLWRTTRITGCYSLYRRGGFVKVLAGSDTPFLVVGQRRAVTVLATGRLVNLLYATWGRFREWRAKRYIESLKRGTL